MVLYYVWLVVAGPLPKKHGKKAAAAAGTPAKARRRRAAPVCPADLTGASRLKRVASLATTKASNCMLVGTCSPAPHTRGGRGGGGFPR